MGYRTFRDSTGVLWDAWDVVPQLGERRTEDRRQSRGAIPFGDRRHLERRLVSSRRAIMTPGMTDGWLCFEGGNEKRRLAPIPSDWSRCAEARLEEYCRRAKPARRSVEIRDDETPR